MIAVALGIFLGALAPKPRPTPAAKVVPGLATVFAELETRFPPERTNPAAFELERLACGLRINLAPPHSARAQKAGCARRDVRLAETTSFATRQPQASSDRIEKPPEAVRGFLGENAEALEKIVDLLSGDEIPRWEVNIRRGTSPDPDYLGHMRLQKVLIAKSLVEIFDDRLDAASRTLEASWNLNAGLMRRPGLVPEMIAIAAARLQAGALRMAPFDPGRWGARMRFDELRASFWASLRDDPVLGVEAGRPEAARSREVFASLMGMRRAADALRKESPCSFSKERSDVFWRGFFAGPIESVLAGIAMPSLAGTAHRFLRLSLEAEMTSRILDSRVPRGEPDGTSAEADPGLPSRVCPGSGWTRSRLADGSSTIAFTGEFSEWPDEPGVHLPLVFTTLAAPSAALP